MEPSRIVDPAATSILARWELGTHPVSSRPESACFTPPGDEQSGEIGPTGKIVDTLSGTTRAPSATPSARVYERDLGGFGVDDRPRRPGKPRRASSPGRRAHRPSMRGRVDFANHDLPPIRLMRENAPKISRGDQSPGSVGIETVGAGPRSVPATALQADPTGATTRTPARTRSTRASARRASHPPAPNWHAGTDTVTSPV